MKPQGVCLRGFRVCIFALNTRIRIFVWQYKVAMYSSNALQSINMSLWIWDGGGAVGGGEGGEFVDEGGCDNDGCAAESDGVSEEAIAAFSTSALCAEGALTWSMLRCAKAQPEVEVACGPPKELHAVMEASSCVRPSGEASLRALFNETSLESKPPHTTALGASGSSWHRMVEPGAKCWCALPRLIERRRHDMRESSYKRK